MTPPPPQWGGDTWGGGSAGSLILSWARSLPQSPAVPSGVAAPGGCLCLYSLSDGFYFNSVRRAKKIYKCHWSCATRKGDGWMPHYAPGHGGGVGHGSPFFLLTFSHYLIFPQ